MPERQGWADYRLNKAIKRLEIIEYSRTASCNRDSHAFVNRAARVGRKFEANTRSSTQKFDIR